MMKEKSQNLDQAISKLQSYVKDPKLVSAETLGEVIALLEDYKTSDMPEKEMMMTPEKKQEVKKFRRYA